MRNKGILYVFFPALFLMFLILTSVWFSSYLYQRSAAAMFSANAVEADTFRKMQLSEAAIERLSDSALISGFSPAEILTVMYPFFSDSFQTWPDSMD
ncbi:MAG: hypothetical protein LUH07_15795 [Lachnospiraceae bacterium]|nr:hypothetical protein [Lachnospiraceae bacterium]